MKIALVTGGSRGLGKNICLHLAARGTDLILTYQSSAEQARELVERLEKDGCKALALQLDVSDHHSFDGFQERVQKALREKWQRDDFDSLVNNAGTGVHASFAETTEEQFDRMVNIHFKGTFFLTQKLLPLLKDGGRIVNISSGLTRFSMPGFSAYASCKAAVEVMTRYLAQELGPRGIAVNVVAPGAIETDFGGGLVRDNPEVNRAIADQTALGRVGLPDDVGGAVAALLSDETGWINGQRVEVSGGVHL